MFSFKIQEHISIGTVLQYKVLQLKHYNSDMFRPFLLGSSSGCVHDP